MALHVKVYDGAGDTVFDAEVDYVSLINRDTYGPPPLVAPGKDSDRALAQADDKVLYINTDLVPLFDIEVLD